MSAYCTQIDPGGYGGMRCGPACCASVLLSEGWQSDPWQLTCELDAKVDPQKDGTTSQDLLTLMADYGFAGGLWYTWDDFRAHRDAGHAVLALCDNAYLHPRMYPPGDNWNALHWIRLNLEHVPDEMVYAYDPLTYLPQPDGTVDQCPNVYWRNSVKDAIAHTAWPEAGIFLVSPSAKDLNRP
jgi:hypothetical protein